MSEQKLPAELRTEFGKGAARRARRANKIPAVLYGHGDAPLHMLLPAKETTLAVRTANALLDLDVNGEHHLALAKDVQRNPIKQIVEHLDLLAVRRGEKVTVDVNIHLEGESAPGTVITLEHPTVSVEAEATHLPQSLTVHVDGRTPGQHVHASDIELPKGVTLLLDDDTLIVNVGSPVVQDLGTTETAEATDAEGAAPAEEPAADNS
jgi:large subunit ribosomal protein L25